MPVTLSPRMALDLTPEQEVGLRKAVGGARFADPGARAEWKRPYPQGEKPHEARRRREPKAIQGEQFPWRLEVAKSVPQQAIKKLGQAFKGFFEGDAEYPKFKKKFQRHSARLDHGRGTFRGSGKRMGVPVWGELRMREGLRFRGKPLSATVSGEADRGLVSLPVEVERPERQGENPAAVGVDLGITTPATLSRGEKLEDPKALRSNLKGLPRGSGAHRRKPAGGSHRRKSAPRRARIPRRIRHLGQDGLHQTTTWRVSLFTRRGIEDLNGRGRWANRHLSLAIVAIGGHEFRRPLEYQSPWYGSQMVVADRGYPSSPRCSIGGYRIENQWLSDRTWRCPPCGSVHDRDKNAAKNLEKYGTVSYTGRDACGELVQSGRSTKQESMSIH